MGGASYSPFDPFQSTENAHDESNLPHRTRRARASRRFRHGRFRPRFSDVADDVIALMYFRTLRSADVGYEVSRSSLG
jgi:hypothetical protein